MNDKMIRSLEDICASLAGITQMEFSIEGKDERYRWFGQTLGRFKYRTFRSRGLSRVWCRATWNGSAATRARP